MRFWDSSALMPLFVEEPMTRVTKGWMRADATVAVWTLTPVEVVSALSRLLREKALDPKDFARALSRAERQLRACHTITNIEDAKGAACRILQTHPLRAADALQLAAALLSVKHRPMRRVFHTFDMRLAEAARKEGFTVPES